VTPEEREVLIEASVGAYRARDVEGLPVELLEEVHRRQVESRELERLIDPAGDSATVKAVMARITR